MNLYLIQQTENTGYDTYSSAVVAAPTPEAARKIHPNGSGKPVNLSTEDRTGHSWVDDPRKVTVRLIGKAVDGVEKGVIVSAFCYEPE